MCPTTPRDGRYFQKAEPGDQGTGSWPQVPGDICQLLCKLIVNDFCLFSGPSGHYGRCVLIFIPRCDAYLTLLLFLATHHGPYADVPCCFVEIGSTESDWDEKVLYGLLYTNINISERLQQHMDKL